jgi:hypothetical protein
MERLVSLRSLMIWFNYIGPCSVIPYVIDVFGFEIVHYFWMLFPGLIRVEIGLYRYYFFLKF